MFQREKLYRGLRYAGMPVVLNALLTVAPLMAEGRYGDDTTTFNMVVSAGAKTCAPNASATVKVRPEGQVEVMDVSVQDMPADTEFEFFVIQVPKAPFGVAWYQGSITTDKHGRGHQQFVGRFSVETFAFAQGTAAAPAVFPADATVNPPFNPIQMYHLGMWFSSPQAAQTAGCPAAQTFFGGDHTAGSQILNTSNFADDHGPLRDVISSDSKN